MQRDIDNKEINDDKLLSGRHDLGISGQNAERNLNNAYSRRKTQYAHDHGRTNLASC